MNPDLNVFDEYCAPTQLQNLQNAMENGWNACLCVVHGHAWVDDSSAGPDSGDMDMYCKRCGLSFHHQLY